MKNPRYYSTENEERMSATVLSEDKRLKAQSHWL
jgi:hypothetical protein